LSSSLKFPSVKARKMRAILRKLGYRAIPGMGKGSHTVLRCDGRGNILFAYHDKDTVSGMRVKKMLTTEAGMTLDEAKEVMGIA